MSPFFLKELYMDWMDERIQDERYKRFNEIDREIDKVKASFMNSSNETEDQDHNCVILHYIEQLIDLKLEKYTLESLLNL